MADKPKRPFLKQLADRLKPKILEPERPETLKFFGQEMRPKTADSQPEASPKPERPVIEKEPAHKHIGIDTMLTSEWWQTGTVRPGKFQL